MIEPLLAQNPERFISLSAAREGFLSESYFEMIKTNLLWDLNSSLDPWYRIPHTINILGYFFFGLWAGKTNVFKKVESHRKQFFIVMIISFFTFLLGSIFVLYDPLHVSNESLLFFIKTLGGRMNMAGLLVFYISSFAILYHLTKARVLLSVFIPVGQMTLTNYIIQSVVGILIFNGVGLGLMTKVGPTITFPLALIFFLQIAFSIMWLKYFTMGPLEWVWRVLVSGKFMPILKVKNQRVYS
ncbi:DUF418 domain-containing protein [Catalinimonas niigatensis]|uniref:DUF418 domain-containing protein n=1 Tax=Catalinimonas niigatensis TaxID=1397264 RepID=UPI0026661723|nr:DUF418 domain-containing protein [Catalinimonas niigatensis]WPP50705.1 DUF418 domain-containing protein [Catalinimonas niigatensis]